MRPPVPMTPTRSVSLAPRTRVEARAVSPPAIRKVRRSRWCVMESILAGQGQRGKWQDRDSPYGKYSRSGDVHRAQNPRLRLVEDRGLRVRTTGGGARYAGHGFSLHGGPDRLRAWVGGQ